jgi:shikimate dehydrogenase
LSRHEDAASQPSAATRVAAVLGHPIGHSLSPALHNAAFAAAGVDWVFIALDVEASQASTAIAGARALGIDGLSITMPLKELAAEAVDRLSPTAATLAAVNTVVREGNELVGHNTDGEGFLDSLRLDHGWDPAGRSCLVFGAGGAARAVVLALAEAGAGEVVIVNRTAARAERAVSLAGGCGRIGSMADVADADLVVNATPIGMAGGGAEGATLIEAIGLLRGAGQVVVDLVYHPALTPLLAAAAARGARPVGGLGMLVHQAAHAFTLWTGQPAPVPVMATAAAAALAH